MTQCLDLSQASAFARSTLGHIGREYPNKLDHILMGPQDAQGPAALHPIFYGSFDWHSCVHGWWQLMRLARLFPDMPEAAEIRARADAMLVPAMVAGETAYLDRPFATGFERPYGWAWLLALHHELAQHPREPWALAVEPLARRFAALFRVYLPKLNYPIRHGIHSNTAFALIFAHQWAQERDPELAALIVDRARHWYGGDKASQAWEPSGDEFLSPTLVEAMAMGRVLPASAFQQWLDDFLPDLAAGRPETLMTPATVSDRADGKLSHLDGLNLSRAWCWRGIAARLPQTHVVQQLAAQAAERHLAASLPHLADDYMGEHWLATFALLGLEAPDSGV